MILTIAAKEFLANLLTWRFGLAVAASIVLLSVSAVVLRADYARRLDAHEAELARIRADLEDIKVYAQLEETVSRPPSPLSVFSEGLEKRMGTILRFSHAKVPTMLTWKKETNPLVAAFPAFRLGHGGGPALQPHGPVLRLRRGFRGAGGEHPQADGGESRGSLEDPGGQVAWGRGVQSAAGGAGFPSWRR